MFKQPAGQGTEGARGPWQLGSSQKLPTFGAQRPRGRVGLAHVAAAVALLRCEVVLTKPAHDQHAATLQGRLGKVDLHTSKHTWGPGVGARVQQSGWQLASCERDGTWRGVCVAW